MLHMFKGYDSYRLLAEFSSKG